MGFYLFTSNSALRGGVYLLDSRSGRVDRVLRGSFRGLTRGPDGAWYVVSGSRNPQRDSSTIHRLDPRDWSSDVVVEHAVKDSHDLKWIDGHFYLVASVGNQILKLDRHGALVDRLQIAENEHDTCHVNCLIEVAGEQYCTVFTMRPGERRDTHRTEAWHTDGKLLRLDWERKSFSVVYEPLSQPHSLVWRDGKLYLVESHTSTATRLDLAQGTRQALRQYTGFLRGLAFGPGEIVMGVCVMYRRDRRRLRPLPWLKTLQERYFPFAGLLVLDENWKLQRRVALPRAEVYDIVPLTEDPFEGR